MKTLFNALSILSVVFLTGCAGKRQQDTNGFLYDMVISDYEKAYFELEGNPVVDYLTDETLVDELLFKKFAEGSPDYFTESDKDTLKLQLLNAKAEKIQSGTVHKKLIESESMNSWYKYGYKGFWESFEKHYGKSGYYRISRPFFSKDRTTFMIILESTYFELPPSEVRYIYQNENDEWVLKSTNVL